MSVSIRFRQRAARIRRFWAGCALASVLIVPSAALASPSGQAETVQQTEVARVLELTNLERAAAGLPPLVLNLHLAQAAQGYSEVLASDECFAHTCGPESDMTRRAEGAGYAGWQALGENIAGGQPTPEAVVDGWMRSPGHRANILNPAFREIGVGRALGGRFGVYWTQVFGDRFDALVEPAFMPLFEPAPVADEPPSELAAEADVAAEAAPEAGEPVGDEPMEPPLEEPTGE